MDLRAMGLPEGSGRLFFLRGDSEAKIRSNGQVTLVFSATDSTLEAYHVTLEDLLEFAGVLEGKLGYNVRVVSPRGTPEERDE
ncbi:hypothetical protein AKJ41_01605 [candidate division MSBL1 archaeon SCGC-AAA259O05]|uniref:Uncharacterized protein n=1 Tax=candidate division MSBL1 archaeon SCGC-AAA259O05 TaxID=1698271 RepID=A0A133V4S5_9EURY|nr:hypothetical protein AKJ41_01605 [candidate division MSBL1 archaeon SCGC-AAA259O05]